MTPGCTRSRNDGDGSERCHFDSLAGGVVGDTGFLPDPTVEAFAGTLGRALRGDRPTTDPVARARRHDWDAVVDQTERVYRDTRDGP